MHELPLILTKQKNDISPGRHSQPDTDTFFPTYLANPKPDIHRPTNIEKQQTDKIRNRIRTSAPSFPHFRSETSFFKPAPVQRKCARCEEEETQIHRKENGNDTINSVDQTEKYLSNLSGGNPLSESEKRFFEPRFGYNLSAVRIHAGAEANQSAKNISALAYTHGNHIVFGANQYQPHTSEGKKLLAHELTHTVQQGGVATTASPIQRQDDKRLEEIKEKLRKGEKLSEEEVEYVKAQIGKDIVQQVLGDAGQIRIDFDSSRKPEDINRRFQGKLQLYLSGAIGAVAKSLEGDATADIDLVATVATQKAVITIAPPTETNRLAATIREQLFPNGAPRSFDFDFPEAYFKYAGAVSLISGITVSITGKGGKHTGGMITINHESVPAGIELIATLSPSARTTNIADTPRQLPDDHWILTPNPDIFGAIGYAGGKNNQAFNSTIGADFPLVYDTKNPLIYAGLGARASLDTNRLARVGGTAFVGLNFDPLSLQLGFGAGAAFLREPVNTDNGPAQTLFYSEVEGKIAYKIVPHLELLTILSFGGGKDLPAYGTAQAGAGFVF